MKRFIAGAFALMALWLPSCSLGGNSIQTGSLKGELDGVKFNEGYYNVSENEGAVVVTICREVAGHDFVFELSGHKDEGPNPYHADKIAITDANTLDTQVLYVETSSLKPNLGFNVVDLNFDGAKDIIFISIEGGSHGNIYYEACLWDDQKLAFVANESFSSICNATVDNDRKAILEISSDSAPSMAYAIYRYIGGVFSKEAALYSEEEMNNDIPCISYKEYSYKGGIESLINSEVCMLDPARADPYRKEGSYWDLKNPIWVSGDHYASEAVFTGYEREIMDLSLKALAYMNAKDWAKLADMVHPEQGLTFSPYGFVDLDTAVCMKASEVKSLASDKKTRVWGSFDGTGEPINMTFDEYYNRFVMNRDFIKAPSKAVDKIIKSSFENNLYMFGNGVSYAEFHYPAESDASGLGWASLRLVFGGYENKPFLVAIVHDEWAI